MFHMNLKIVKNLIKTIQKDRISKKNNPGVKSVNIIEISLF